MCSPKCSFRIYIKLLIPEYIETIDAIDGRVGGGCFADEVERLHIAIRGLKLVSLEVSDI